jgi:hypothetical protein
MLRSPAQGYAQQLTALIMWHLLKLFVAKHILDDSSIDQSVYPDKKQGCQIFLGTKYQKGEKYTK